MRNVMILAAALLGAAVFLSLPAHGSAAELSVRPRSLVFELGDSRRELEIANAGTGKLRWKIYRDRKRFRLSPRKGTIGDGTDTVAVRMLKGWSDWLLVDSNGGRQWINAMRVLYDLPRDHRFHKDLIYQSPLSMEWLYFTGVVNDVETGDLYGYEANIFQVWDEARGAFAYRTDISVSDVSGSEFRFATLLTAATDAVRFDPARGEFVWEYTDTGITMRHWESSDVWEISAENGKTGGERLSLDLVLVNASMGYYPESPVGVVRMGDCDQGTIFDMIGLSYYYTHPDLTTVGVLGVGGERAVVRGTTWFDHQWGNFNNCPTNWDWFSLRFEDGSRVMLFRFNERGDNTKPVEEQKTGAYFGPGGAVYHRWGSDTFTATPVREIVSTVCGKRFRVEWILETPLGTFGIKPLIEQQVIDDPEDPYYEGIMEVRSGGLDGEVVGTAYLETSFAREE